MAEYLLDTTVLIDYLRGHAEVVGRLQDLAQQGHELCVCSICVAELFSGLGEEDRAEVGPFLSSLRYLDFTYEVAVSAGVWRYAFARQGRPLKVTDTLIGAAALSNLAVLLTDNVKDFPLPGLKVERLPSRRRPI